MRPFTDMYPKNGQQLDMSAVFLWVLSLSYSLPKNIFFFVSYSFSRLSTSSFSNEKSDLIPEKL